LSVVGSSAVVAVLYDEATDRAILARLDLDTERLMSAAPYLETGSVIAGRRPRHPRQALAERDAMLRNAPLLFIGNDFRTTDVLVAR